MDLGLTSIVFGDTILKMRKSELKRILKEIGLIPQKRLGQNFLASEEIAERIVDAASLSKDDFVVEVGAGLGIVTEKILSKGASVLAVEIDKKLSSYLRKRFSKFKNLQLLERDFFELDKKKLLSYKDKRRMKFISNPPFKGAKKLLKNLSLMNSFSSVVITLQKGVADAILVQPSERDSSRLTYYLYYRYKPAKLFDIPLNFFYPEPRINSSTILLLPTYISQPKVSSEKFFFKTVDLLLKTKRRKLKNNIRSNFNISYNKIEELLDKSGIVHNARPTDLTLEQMINLSNLLKVEIQNKYGK